MNEALQRKAAVLFELSEEEQGSLEAVQAILRETRAWNLLRSPAASAAEKEELLHTLPPLAGKPALEKFLRKIVGEGLLESLPQILEEARRLSNIARERPMCRVICAREPDAPTLADIQSAACKLYHLPEAVLLVELDPTILGGFILEYQGVTYDRSVRGGLNSMSRALQEQDTAAEDLIDSLESGISAFTRGLEPSELGQVQELGDGIVTLSGLERAFYGEMLEFENGARGMVMGLNRDSVGTVLLGSQDGLTTGSIARRTGRQVEVPVGDALLGRVVDALGRPIDGGGKIESVEFRPVEREASGVVTREPVSVPLQTGILAIDAMTPIGRGQRELIIGDRQTGKTALAVDTILNQKDQNVVCIYVAIGQKASSVVRVRDTLTSRGAMDYTIIVSATAGESAPLQYLAPYSGAAMGEYFMEKGEDVLIVYDDLSKHAVAYRALSLLLRRSPGREAYPGDVFYLHSRLLERACRLTEAHGGGSMTALPVIETQAGDSSAYIPTNVISITDGQIYLETDLFFSGQRPAVNVGLSVSRVGGAAQTRAVKRASGTLRMDLARFRELEVFTQFSSDLDAATQHALDHGKRLMELLKQPQYDPMPMHRQVVVLYIATSGLLEDVPTEQVRNFAMEFVQYLESEHSEVMDDIRTTGNLSAPTVESIRSALEAYKQTALAKR